MTAVVLDASALIAFLRGEPGADAVEDVIEEAVISAVNWSEVNQRLLAASVDVAGLREDVEALGASVTAFDAEDAERAAGLWPSTREAGLSLGDRACIALAQRLGVPAVTADREWLGLELPVEVQPIR